MSVQADANTLQQIPIFANCQPFHLQLLAFSAEKQKFGPGELIIEQGQKAQSSFLILNGRVKIFQSFLGHVTVLAQGVPGTYLGEIAMIAQSAYAISAQAEETVTTARIDHKLFLKVATEYPEFGQTVLRALSQNLQHTVQDFGTAHKSFVVARSFLDL